MLEPVKNMERIDMASVSKCIPKYVPKAVFGIEFRSILYYINHIRPLRVRLLANPEHVPKSWGFFMCGAPL